MGKRGTHHALTCGNQLQPGEQGGVSPETASLMGWGLQSRGSRMTRVTGSADGCQALVLGNVSTLCCIL